MEDAVADAVRIKDKEKKTKEGKWIISWFNDSGLKTKREWEVWRE